MCGRFIQAFSAEDILDMFDEQLSGGVFLPRYNVAPTTPVLTVVTSGDEVILTPMHWGLQPEWTDSVIINAQAEKYIAPKRSFWTKFERCVIPATGFYEWRKGGGRQKQPMFISRKDGTPLLFAGLFRIAMTPEGKAEPHCVIVTTRPNAVMKDIHHRMPAMLHTAHIPVWMDDELKNTAFSDILLPFPDELISARPVSTAVNDVRNDDPSLIEPTK